MRADIRGDRGKKCSVEQLAAKQFSVFSRTASAFSFCLVPGGDFLQADGALGTDIPNMLMTEQSPSVSPPLGGHQVATDVPLSAFLPCNAIGSLQGAQEAAEQLIPEEGKASGDSSLQQAG